MLRNSNLTPSRISNKLLSSTLAALKLYDRSLTPSRSSYKTQRISPIPSRNITNKLREVYGITLGNVITAKCLPQRPNLETIPKEYNKPLLPLSSLGKYPTKIIFMNKMIHKKIVNKSTNPSIKTEYKRISDHYLKRAEALTRVKADKDDIGQLFSDLFEELETVVPDCKKLFTSMKILAQSLGKKTISINKSIASTPHLAETETEGTELTIERSKPGLINIGHSGNLKTIQAIASTKRMSLPAQLIFSKSKFIIKNSQTQNNIKNENEKIQIPEIRREEPKINSNSKLKEEEEISIESITDKSYESEFNESYKETTKMCIKTNQ